MGRMFAMDKQPFLSFLFVYLVRFVWFGMDRCINATCRTAPPAAEILGNVWFRLSGLFVPWESFLRGCENRRTNDSSMVNR